MFKKKSGFIDSGLVKLGYKYNTTLCLIETVSFLESKASYLKKCLGKNIFKYDTNTFSKLLLDFFGQNASLCCVQS